MILSFKKLVLILLFLLLFNKFFFATVVVNAPTCNQTITEKICDRTGNCTDNLICAFPPVNITKFADARGQDSSLIASPIFASEQRQPLMAEPQIQMPPFIFLTLDSNAAIKNLGNIEVAQQISLHLLPQTHQHVITYIPHVGAYTNQSISFLFYMIDLAEKSTVENAPFYIKNQIQKYIKEHPESRYVFFIAKNNRNLEQWNIINQTYIADLNVKGARINIAVQPDGNISLLIPTIFNEAENKIDKPQLFSIDIGQI